MVLGLAKPTPLHAVSASNGFWGLLAGRPDKRGGGHRKLQVLMTQGTFHQSSKAKSAASRPDPPSFRGSRAVFCLPSQFYISKIFMATILFKKRSQNTNSLKSLTHTRNEKHQVLVMKMPMGSPSCRLKGLVLPKSAFKY